MVVGCVDVGGTAVKAGVLSSGSLTSVRSVPTPAPGEDIDCRILDVVGDVVAELVEEAGPLDAVGMVVPGIVDAAAGIGVWSENLGWRDVKFGPLLSARTGLPVAFGHDVRAGGLAEARLGAGVGYRDVVFLPIGTGIAGAFVTDGVVYDRDRPTFEIGHVALDFHEPCVCGLTGCLEAVASARAIARRYAARTRRAADAAEIASLLPSDDDAAAVWSDATAALGEAIAWLAAVLAPEVVVLGGGLARSGALLLDPVAAEVDKRLSFHHRPVLKASTFGDLAGCVGAGLLAEDLVAR